MALDFYQSEIPSNDFLDPRNQYEQRFRFKSSAFPPPPSPSLELICLMGEVAECADRSEGGEGGVCYLSRF